MGRARDFLLAGILVAFIDATLFLLLMKIFGAIEASLISGACALTVGWFTSSLFVFRDREKATNSGIRFASLGTANYLLGNTLLAAQLSMHLNEVLAKFLSMITVTAVSFLVQRKFVFPVKKS